jgi:hypothetical protein
MFGGDAADGGPAVETIKLEAEIDATNYLARFVLNYFPGS